ncbi:hypothetical protein M501DRAFT_996088 [Patellaria atrata CBS 101060]|uniref:RING-type domain-containing protein n=1 Tax=Patellaria atrata CBS 101060 TaxID=1346257 RepID=A0A9P4VPP6_9PEZI|nr:hypothetical protein M501DRAFT_996088 [Patellaria atrata CBS 101060]
MAYVSDSIRKLPSRITFVNSLRMIDMNTLDADDRKCFVCMNTYWEDRGDGSAEHPVRIHDGHHMGVDCAIILYTNLGDHKTNNCPVCRKQLFNDRHYLAGTRVYEGHSHPVYADNYDVDSPPTYDDVNLSRDIYWDTINDMMNPRSSTEVTAGLVADMSFIQTPITVDLHAAIHEHIPYQTYQHDAAYILENPQIALLVVFSHAVCDALVGLNNRQLPVWDLFLHLRDSLRARVESNRIYLMAMFEHHRTEHTWEDVHRALESRIDLFLMGKVLPPMIYNCGRRLGRARWPGVNTPDAFLDKAYQAVIGAYGVMIEVSPALLPFNGWILFRRWYGTQWRDHDLTADTAWRGIIWGCVVDRLKEMRGQRMSPFAVFRLLCRETEEKVKEVLLAGMVDERVRKQLLPRCGERFAADAPMIYLEVVEAAVRRERGFA